MDDLKPIKASELRQMGVYDLKSEITEIYKEVKAAAEKGQSFLSLELPFPTAVCEKILKRLENLFPDSDLEWDADDNYLRITWEVKCPAKVVIHSRPVTASSPCFRCGRTSHWVEDCQASTDVRGNRL